MEINRLGAMIKRYLLFKTEPYENSGGFKDLFASVNKLKNLKYKLANEHISHGYRYHIVDVEKKLLYDFYDLNDLKKFLDERINKCQDTQ